MKRIYKLKLALAGAAAFALCFLWTVLPLHL